MRIPAIALLAAVCAGPLPAATVYYTFEGTVAFVDDSSGRVARLGIQEDAPVFYVFAVDTAGSGYSESGDGSRTAIRDTVEGSVRQNYFFDSLISTPRFPMAADLDGQSYFGQHTSEPNATGSLTLFHHQRDAGDSSVIVGIALPRFDTGMSMLPELNEMVQGTETFTLKDGSRSLFYAALTVTAISEVKPNLVRPRSRAPWIRVDRNGPFLSIRNLSGSAARAHILDFRGRLLLSMPVPASQPLPLPGLAPGRYLLRVTAPGRAFATGFSR